MNNIELAPYFERMKEACKSPTYRFYFGNSRQRNKRELEEERKELLSAKPLPISNLAYEEWINHVEYIYSLSDFIKNQDLYLYYLSKFKIYGYNDPMDVLHSKEHIEKNEYMSLLERANSVSYIRGALISKQYTKEEMLEKRKYYESLSPHPQMSKKRWLYEIKRNFECESAEKYPDVALYSVELRLKYGLR